MAIIITDNLDIVNFHIAVTLYYIVYMVVSLDALYYTRTSVYNKTMIS